MQIVPTEEAVGMALCHDIMEYIPGRFKGAAFKKGHIVRENDIPKLLNVGKKHIYVMDLAQYAEMLHKNEAVRRMPGNSHHPTHTKDS